MCGYIIEQLLGLKKLFGLWRDTEFTGGFVFYFLKSAVSLLEVDVCKASLDIPQMSQSINTTVFIRITLGTFRVALQTFFFLTALAY